MPDEHCMCNERNVSVAYKAASQSVCKSDNASRSCRHSPEHGCWGSCPISGAWGDAVFQTTSPSPALLLFCSRGGNKWLQLTLLFMPGQLFWSLVGGGVEPILCPFSANSFTGGRIWKAESECYTTAESKAGQSSASGGETAWLHIRIIPRVADSAGHVFTIWTAVYISIELPISVQWQ